VTEQQLARMAKRRLAILRQAKEITGNVSLTCRVMAGRMTSLPKTGPPIACVAVAGGSIGMGGPGPP
jgi:hypothetical protein